MIWCAPISSIRMLVQSVCLRMKVTDMYFVMSTEEDQDHQLLKQQESVENTLKPGSETVRNKWWALRKGGKPNMYSIKLNTCHLLKEVFLGIYCFPTSSLWPVSTATLSGMCTFAGLVKFPRCHDVLCGFSTWSRTHQLSMCSTKSTKCVLDGKTSTCHWETHGFWWFQRWWVKIYWSLDFDDPIWKRFSRSEFHGYKRCQFVFVFFVLIDGTDSGCTQVCFFHLESSLALFFFRYY